MSEVPAKQRFLIFDLDGVITTERIYWECARLTVWELMQVSSRAVQPYVPAVHDRDLRSQVISEALVFALKDRAINSNWDLTYLVACGMLAELPSEHMRNVRSVADLLAALGNASAGTTTWNEPVWHLLHNAEDRQGVELLAFAGQSAALHLDIDGALCEPEGPLWQYLFSRFQAWYDGKLMALWGASRLEEKPVLPLAELQRILAALRSGGYVLCAATGRPRAEALYALKSFELDTAFESGRIATYDDVLEAQEVSGRTGLGKPHPYVIFKALLPERGVEALVNLSQPDLPSAIMVGDSTSDAIAAQRSGIACVGVLSGVTGQTARDQRREALLAAGSSVVLDDIRMLPDWLAAHG